MKVGPFMIRVNKRVNPGKLEILIISILTVLCAFLVFSLAFWEAGVNPLIAYWRLISYSFMSISGVEYTLRRTTFMLLVTLAFIVPMRAGIWNIGAPGQVFAGMSAGLSIALAGAELPSFILIPLMGAGAMVCGGALAAIAGFLTGRFNVDSVVVTIMLNLIMMYFVLYLIEGPLTSAGGRTESAQVPVAGQIPMIGDTSIPYTIIPAILISFLLYVFLTKTILGYEVEAFGNNPEASRVVGMSFSRVAVITMCTAGAIGGLAGFHQVAGEPGVYRITSGYWSNVGMWSFYGIVFGLLAFNNPITAILPAFVFSGFQVGARRFEYLLGLPHGVDLAFFGTLMIVVVIGQFFYKYRLSVGLFEEPETPNVS